MTLCIAALASEIDSEKAVKTSVYFCSDYRIETFAAGSETEYKFHKVSDSWAGMLAGNVARASELLDLYSSHLAGKAPTGEQAVHELRIPVQLFKKRLASEYIASMTGLLFEDFLVSGQTTLPPALYERLWGDIARIEIGCQLILVPTDAHRLYSVDSDGSVSVHKVFCAIGSGASNAEAWLHYREQGRYLGLSLTGVHLLEAKRFAENAPGVGRKTSLSILDSEKNLHQFAESHVQAAEREIWKRYGPRRPKKGVADPVSDPMTTPWSEVGIG
jgi:20S proteasome alpha/beta subunit